MPMTPAITETSANTMTVASSGACSATPAPSTMGARKLWMKPPSGGKPVTMPRTADPAASAIKGNVITRGDSCAWS